MVFRAKAVRGWSSGLEALAGALDSSASQLLGQASLIVKSRELQPAELDGVGAMLKLGKIEDLG